MYSFPLNGCLNNSRYTAALKLLLWMFFTPVLTGCVSTSLTTIEYNASTDTFEEVKYSSHFEGQEYLIKDKLKVLIYADMQGSGSGDATKTEEKWDKADFKIYFSNKSPSQLLFAVNTILFQNHYYSDKFLSESKKLQIVPNTVERIILNDKVIDRFDKEFKILIDYTYGARNYTKEIVLKRMTVDEYKEVKPKLFNF